MQNVVRLEGWNDRTDIELRRNGTPIKVDLTFRRLDSSFASRQRVSPVGLQRARYPEKSVTTDEAKKHEE